MGRVPAWRRYARFFGADVGADVDDELRFHLEEKARALIEAGLPAADARAEALRQFGELSETRRLCEAYAQSDERTTMRRLYWAGWWGDLRYGLRTLRRAPLVSAMAVLSLALGIGANTAIFTLLDQVILRGLPVNAPNQLVRVQTRGFYYGSTVGSGRELTYPLYRAVAERRELFDGVLAVVPFTARMSAGDRTEALRGEQVTGTYFGTLGIGAIRGRVFGQEDSGTAQSAVISHACWMRRFAGDPGILGRIVTINNQPMTIIGVVAPGFDGIDLTTATEVFVTLEANAYLDPGSDRLRIAGLRWLNVFARLRPGVTPERATVALEPAYRAFRQEDVKDARFRAASRQTRERFLNENHIEAEPAPGGHTPLRASLTRPLWALMGIALGVLLIACANVAGLLLARAASRQRELAVRLSLGATRGRIVRQLLVESLILAVAGGVAGVLLAAAGVHILIGVFVDPQGSTLISATPDLRILGFTLAVAVLTVLLFGVAPAMQATRPALAPTLKDQAGSILGGGHVRLRKALVVVQVALSLVLLIGAGLFVRSLTATLTMDLGIRRDHLVTFEVDPKAAGYQAARVKPYAMGLLAQLRAAPGVAAAGFASIGILQGGAWGNSISVEGYTPKDGEQIGSRCNRVSPGYFDAMGIPLLMGRDFRDADSHAREQSSKEDEEDEGYRVAIVSESFVRTYIRGNPLGRHIGLGGDPGTPTRIEIVGVVRDSTYTSPLERRQWQVYFPYLEDFSPEGATFYVRTAGEPEAMLQNLRAVVQGIDPKVPVSSPGTVDERLNRLLVNERVVTALSAVFGGAATVLAMIGLYGVMAYTVARRTREIGIRMALGALARRVVWLMMAEALALVTAGVALALPSAWWLSQYIRSELHGIDAVDPTAIGFAVAAIVLTAATASLIPSIRAARISPTVALRQE
jgi:predicted permease